jgi:hypothetical protein
MIMDPKVKKELDALKAKVKRLESDLSKARSSGNSGEKFKSFLGDSNTVGEISELAGALGKQYQDIEKSIKDISKSGALFIKGGPLQEGLNESVKEMNLLFGNSEAGAASFAALTESVMNFQQLSKATSDTVGTLAGSLSKQAAVLAELGLSYGDFSKNIDIAIYSMGATREQVQGLNASIVTLSKEVGMLPSQMSQNFQSVSKTLAYNFTQIKDEFLKIQKLSNETGVSIDNLMGKFGSPMDTIGGASQMAAKLNSLLGQNRFSATELLMMTEEDRMTSIRGALMDSGAAGNALEGGVQGKFALQSINEVLGLGLDDTRRFLQTGGLKGDIASQVRDDFTGPGGELGPKQFEGFIRGIDDSEAAITKFRDLLLSFMDPQQMGAIYTRERELRSGGGVSTLGKAAMQFGTFSEVGAFSTKDDNVLTAARQSPEFRKLLRTFNEGELGAAGIDRAALAKEIIKGGTFQQSAEKRIRGLDPKIKRGKLSQTDESVLKLIDTAGFNKFGIRDRVRNFLRSDTTLDALDANDAFEKIKTQLGLERIVEEGEALRSQMTGQAGTPVPPQQPTPGGRNQPGSTGASGASGTYNFYLGTDPLVSVIDGRIVHKLKKVSPIPQ